MSPTSYCGMISRAQIVLGAHVSQGTKSEKFRRRVLSLHALCAHPYSQAEICFNHTTNSATCLHATHISSCRYKG